MVWPAAAVRAGRSRAGRARSRAATVAREGPRRTRPRPPPRSYVACAGAKSEVTLNRIAIHRRAKTKPLDRAWAVRCRVKAAASVNRHRAQRHPKLHEHGHAPGTGGDGRGTRSRRERRPEDQVHEHRDRDRRSRLSRQRHPHMIARLRDLGRRAARRSSRRSRSPHGARARLPSRVEARMDAPADDPSQCCFGPTREKQRWISQASSQRRLGRSPASCRARARRHGCGWRASRLGLSPGAQHRPRRRDPRPAAGRSTASAAAQAPRPRAPWIRSRMRRGPSDCWWRSRRARNAPHGVESGVADEPCLISMPAVYPNRQSNLRPGCERPRQTAAKFWAPRGGAVR